MIMWNPIIEQKKKLVSSDYQLQIWRCDLTNVTFILYQYHDTPSVYCNKPHIRVIHG